MGTLYWKKFFVLGLIFAAAGAATLPAGIGGLPTSPLGLFGFGTVLILAGLARRNRAA